MSGVQDSSFRLILTLRVRKCSICHRFPLIKHLYKCLECLNIHFCFDCFQKRHYVKGHSDGHAMIYLHQHNELFGRSVTSNDLTLNSLETSYKNEINENIHCDGCQTPNFVGLRFKCDSCQDFDLCHRCYSNGTTALEHKTEHPMILASHRSIIRIEPEEIQYEKLLGRGSYGKVTQAIWLTRNRRVACKEIPVGETDNENSFFNELRTHNELCGGHIVPMFAYGVKSENGKRIYLIIMELMENGSLENFLEKNEKISFRRKCRMAIEIVGAMKKLHEHQIIHRDIRPDNILIDSKFHAKISDFGIVLIGEMTDDERRVGCRRFMPPEFYDKRNKITDKIDIFTFGLTLNQLFTEEKHEYSENHRPRIRLTSKSPIFADLIERCLSSIAETRPTAIEIEGIFQESLQSFEAFLINHQPKYEECSREERDRLFIEFYQTRQ